MTNEHQVCFQRDGQNLYGVVHEPLDSARSVGIIFLNGWGGYRIGPHRIYVKAARTFSAQGFHVLRFDFRGTGDSDGAMANVSSEDVQAFISDSRAAIDFLRERYHLKCWYLLGLCSGGEIAVLYASGVGKVHGLILWSVASHLESFRREEPTRRLSHYLRIYLRKLTLRSTWQRLWRGRIRVRSIMHTLFFDFGARSGPASKKASRPSQKPFASFQGPVLLIYGTVDPHAKSSSAFFEDCLSQEKVPYQLHMIDGADTSFSSLAFEKDVLTITQDWLVTQSTQ
jgi:uncharacterized protein